MILELYIISVLLSFAYAVMLTWNDIKHGVRYNVPTFILAVIIIPIVPVINLLPMYFAIFMS